MDFLDIIFHNAKPLIATLHLTVPAALSLAIGLVLLFFWLRENFTVLSEPMQKQIKSLFGVSLDLKANDFAHPARYRRARTFYVSFFLILYVVVCLLGINVAKLSGLLPATFVETLKDADSFPLVLALAIQATNPTLPHVVSLESRIRSWLHELITIPTEVESIAAEQYAIFVDTATACDILEVDESEISDSGDGRTPYLIDGVFSLTRTLASLPPAISKMASSHSFEKMLEYSRSIELRGKALYFDHQNKGSSEQLIGHVDRLIRDALLAIGCVVSTTPPDKRPILLKALNLRGDQAGWTLYWHEILSSQLFVLFLFLLPLVAFGAPVGQELAKTLSMPALPLSLNDVIYSWLLPDGVPFLIAYCLLFAVFADRPRLPNLQFSAERPENDFYTRLFTASFITYGCALGARLLWLVFASVKSSPGSAILPESAILALSSVGTAVVATLCQTRIKRHGTAHHSIWISILIVLIGLAVCVLWNTVIGEIYIQARGDAGSSGYLIMMIAFHSYCALGIMVGTILRTAVRRPATEDSPPGELQLAEQKLNRD